MSTLRAMLKRQLKWAGIIVGGGVIFFLIFPEKNPFLVGRELPFNLAGSTDLTVVVTGLEEREGQIILLVYNSEETYLNAPFRQKIIGLSGDPNLKATFQNVPAGRYAAAAFHDENASNSLDVSLIGTLSEYLVFSNAATAPIGAPLFQDASFRVEGEALALAMDLSPPDH